MNTRIDTLFIAHKPHLYRFRIDRALTTQFYILFIQSIQARIDTTRITSFKTNTHNACNTKHQNNNT